LVVCDSLVVHCMDFRLQGFLNRWLESRFPENSYDRVSLAGGVHDIDTVLRQVEFAVTLHTIEGVILINHEDCGAYGTAGDFARHEGDLLHARKKVKSRYPELKVFLYYL
jgi:carbonic anhydrase